uniref:Uncharacterized protein n=1 Tax=Haptolina brevifila TaxID=156173 RepID=A0A7S2IZF8_9EUKA|mmetsp:Transcript_74190/g.147469  ORF Transcript_74190/g.147469 Transcript_74190/m.147469 type:complete len:108 (+) Transcript_74190:157-480(+)
MQLAAVKVLIRAPTVTLQENPESKNLAEGRQAEQLEAAKCGHTGAAREERQGIGSGHARINAQATSASVRAPLTMVRAKGTHVSDFSTRPHSGAGCMQELGFACNAK